MQPQDSGQEVDIRHPLRYKCLSTPLRWILKKEKKKKEKKRKKRYKKLVTHVEPQASAVSLLKRAENSAI